MTEDINFQSQEKVENIRFEEIIRSFSGQISPFWVFVFFLSKFILNQAAFQIYEKRIFREMNKFYISVKKRVMIYCIDVSY